MRVLTLAAALVLSTAAYADEIWVSNEKDDTISVIDVESLEVVRTIEVGERPRGITFAIDHSVLFLCASDSDAVQVIDPKTGKVLHDLPSGEDPEQFILHPDNRHLYIANEDDAITTVVDVESRKVIAQIDEQNPALAAKLAQMVHDFDYDEILALWTRTTAAGGLASRAAIIASSPYSASSGGMKLMNGVGVWRRAQ